MIPFLDLLSENYDLLYWQEIRIKDKVFGYRVYKVKMFCPEKIDN